MKNVAMARSSRNLLKRLAHRGAMKNVAITGSRIHESCRLCTMKNVAFLPSEPWKPSPLAMRNVALAIDRHEHREKCRFSSTLNKPPCRSIRGTERIIWPCTTRYGSTMENVALNHEKCRYCPFSSGNQERKESYQRKNKTKKGDRRRILVLPWKESKQKRTELRLSCSDFKVLNSSSSPSRRRDVMRRGRQSL